MPRHASNALDRVEIASPCSAEWDSMRGNERVRFCQHCRLHVRDVSTMSPAQALLLVRGSQGRLCLRIHRLPDGSLVTRGRPEPLYQIRRRVSRVAAGAFGAALGLSAASAQAQVLTPTTAQAVAAEQSAPAPAACAGQSGDVRLYKEWKETVTMGVIAIVEPSEPLVKAASDNDLEAVLKLLGGGADASVLDKATGTSALAQAVANGNREMVVELLRAGAEVNARLEYRQTALMRLSHKTSEEVVRELLFAGAKVNARDENGFTALMAAAGWGAPDVVELLLRAGARVNARNDEGTTPLMLAAGAGLSDHVRALVSAGADLELRDGGGSTALTLARDNEHTETADLLVAYGAKDERPPKPPEEAAAQP